MDDSKRFIEGGKVNKPTQPKEIEANTFPEEFEFVCAPSYSKQQGENYVMKWYLNVPKTRFLH